MIDGRLWSFVQALQGFVSPNGKICSDKLAF